MSLFELGFVAVPSLFALLRLGAALVRKDMLEAPRLAIPSDIVLRGFASGVSDTVALKDRGLGFSGISTS